MKNRKYTLCIVIVLISLIMCVGYITGHYSTDDYHIMNVGYKEYSINNNLIEGRPIMFLIDQLFLKLNISYDAFIIITVVIAILLTDLNVLLVYKLVNDKYTNKNKLLLFTLLFSTIFNFMYIENLYFVESIVMALSLVLYTLSCKHFFRDGKWNKLIALLFNILATMSYNGFECYYIILIAFISLLNYKKINKNVLFNILKAGLLIIISVLLNYLQISICCSIFNLNNSRISSFSLLYNIFTIIIMLPYFLIITSRLFPKYLFIICLFLVLGFSFIYNKKHEMNNLFRENIFLSFVCIMSCFCINIISLSSIGTGRLSYGIGMTIGILLLYIFFNINDKKTFYKIFLIFSVFWIGFNILNYFNQTLLSKNNNVKEKEEALKLDKMLKKYEFENNIKVNKVAFVFYLEMRKDSVINTNAIRTEWSSQGAIEFYTKRDMEKINLSPKEMEKYNKELEDKVYFIDNDMLVIKMYDW